jgi:predicted molibdopterin-dependent oxidoreductase YjgC
MRIQEHPVLQFDRKKKVSFKYNEQEVEAFPNETVAAALHAAGIRKFGHSSKSHNPRGLFCAIGNCSSCFMNVNGEPNVRICVTLVEEGMIVEEQEEKGVIWSE